MRARIDAGELVLCMALTQARTADVPWLAAAAGYDAVYVDLEHTATSFETTALLCSAAIGAGITPLVRVPSHDHQYLTRSLDIGAMGVIVPHVDTVEEAESIADACRFPPRGHRSVVGTERGEPLPADAATRAARLLRRPDHRGRDARDARRDRRCRRHRVGRGHRHGDGGSARPHRRDGDPRPVPRRGVPRRGAHGGQGVSRPRHRVRHRRHPRRRAAHGVRRAGSALRERGHRRRLPVRGRRCARDATPRHSGDGRRVGERPHGVGRRRLPRRRRPRVPTHARDDRRARGDRGADARPPARCDHARARRSSRRRRPGARGLRGDHPRPRSRGGARPAGR